MSGRTAGARPDTGESELRPIPAWGATTHVGGVRRHNEDAFYVSDDVCVVADGMGGDEAGDGASQLVTRLVSDVFGAHRLDVAELPRLVSSLNTTVRRTGAENGTPGMGATLVGVAVAENGDTPSAVVFDVGDSRCYRLANGTMTQLTTDHSHVQELVEIGAATAIWPGVRQSSQAIGCGSVLSRNCRYTSSTSNSANPLNTFGCRSA